jgi:hypothetical protein
LASFRRYGRFPTATYVHKGSSGKIGEGCTLWRCAEPSNCLLIDKCEEDILNFLEMGCNNDSENNTLQVFTIRKEPFEDLKQKDFGFEN